MNNEITMRAKLAALSADNKKLRRIAQESRQDVLLTRITIDAQQLLIWRYTGFSVSRRNAEEMGMTQRRWTWARALLQHARIYDEKDVTADTFDAALSALETSVNYLRHAGLESLKMRLPQHVLLANHMAKVAANHAAHGLAHNDVKKLATTRVDHTVGGDPSRGPGRDRRAEIEQRMRRMGGD